MNIYKTYLYKELNNLPFDLFKILKEYISLNDEVRIAFVGGFVRDLLIKKIHRVKANKIIDFDLIIEGSALSLAKYIKKNIKHVDLCLIKEFELYNTVELNINDIKVDIASSREEIYKAPGFNPSVKDSSISNDLRRRDFSINSIAFEISKSELYDPFNGITHIKKKEIHLLHNKSIQDDPSRVLRSAKYATRLGFEFSNESLLQSKQIIEQWPWQCIKKDNLIKFPPGISIRIRMELTEIIKHDNLAQIVQKLYQWDVISLLNKDIEVDNRFMRGLHWIRKLKGKEILFIIKDSKSLDKLCERLFINKKEKKIINELLKIKNKLVKDEAQFIKLTPSRWTNFIEKNNLDLDAVKLIIANGGKYWRPFLRWLYKYRFIKSTKNGELLKSEGWEPGEMMGQEIRRLRYEEIDKL